MNRVLIVLDLHDSDAFFATLLNSTYPYGKDIMQFMKSMHFITIIAEEKIKSELAKKDNEKKQDAKKIAEKINKKEYNVKKLSTENNELYGSVKPTEISKLILEADKIEIKPSLIQPVQDIKTIGKFKVKISLHSEVDAIITINVESSETIQ